MPKLNLSADEVLTTTRAVRKRLDFERPLDMSEVKQCLQVALQAPSGSNAQGWHFIVVNDRERIEAIARYYRQSFEAYAEGPAAPDKQHADDPGMHATQQRVLESARYLSDNMHRMPALLIPCTAGLSDAQALPVAMSAGIFGSILPAVWNFMLAARERGIGTCWTTLHLNYEREVADLLQMPTEMTQVALIPMAYTLGTDFKTAPRKPLDGVVHFNHW